MVNVERRRQENEKEEFNSDVHPHESVCLIQDGVFNPGFGSNKPFALLQQTTYPKCFSYFKIHCSK